MSLPPDPPLSTPSLNLFLKVYCPKDGGKHSRVGYQLADYQFYPGIDKEVIKNRFDSFNPADFDENENKVISLFQKAYEDGFEEKKYYDIENLEEIGRW